MRFVRLQGIVCPLDPRTIGLPWRRRRGCFQPVRRLIGGPSPGTCAPGSFPRVSPPLRSSFASLSDLRLSTRSLLPGSLPSSRHHRWSPHPRAFSVAPLGSVLRFSQPLDGFLHHRLYGLVSSRSHVQGFHRSGVSPVPRRAPSRRWRLAPVSLSRPRSPAKAGCHARAPRLRGFVPRSDALCKVEV